MTEDRPPQPGAPGAGGAYEPPPITAFAWRYGLVRPSQGRILAGVCGAFGRATNTDPVLWRVVIAVLTIFGGIGALAYLLGWLLLPSDGDTATPVEALAGRGRSGTSTVLTIIGGVIVVISLAAYVSDPFRATPLLAVVLLGGALLLLLRDRQRNQMRAASGPAVAPMWSTASAPSGVVPPAADDAPTAAGEPSTAPAWTPAPPPPFAPHRPFVPTPPPPYVPMPPTPPPPPRPKRPKSRLGLLTFSVLLLALGVLALLDLAGLSVAGPAYAATALGIVGLGLLVGAFMGRARGLIAIGIILIFVLGGTIAGSHVNRNGWVRGGGGTTTWVPASLDSIQDGYQQSVGDATLDLTEVDFSGLEGTKTIDVTLDVGNLTVRLPSNVDVTVDASVDAGNAQVFREQWGGLGSQSRTVTDYGSDGPGAGKLLINAKVSLGNLEVHR
jgi:phage shock protein PspC (stress-responsive transcriptional regulator)